MTAENVPTAVVVVNTDVFSEIFLKHSRTLDLTVACRRAGHGLQAKDHTGDRWIAATAIAMDRPLLSLDRIFTGMPALRLTPFP